LVNFGDNRENYPNALNEQLPKPFRMILYSCTRQFTILVCLPLMLMVFCKVTHSQPGNRQTITSIENNLYAITATGKDTGNAQTVYQRMESLGVKGMSVAVFDNGKIIWTRGYGFRNESSFCKAASFSFGGKMIFWLSFKD
jgi:hypothetical protein